MENTQVNSAPGLYVHEAANNFLPPKRFPLPPRQMVDYDQVIRDAQNRHPNFAIPPPHAHNSRRGYGSDGSTRPTTARWPNQKQYSTPQDQFKSPGLDNSFNQSLVALLENQQKIQQDTAQALSAMASHSNDAFLNDLPMFSGDEKAFLNWILKIEKVARLTGRSERGLAAAKSEGAVANCLLNLPRDFSWKKCKKTLREHFSSLQTENHASVHLMNQAQRPNESLQEYIYWFSELIRIITKCEPQNVTCPMKITLFIKNLFNREIQKGVCKGTHHTLSAAFESALKAESKAKKFEGLTDDAPTVMMVNAVTPNTTPGD